MFGYRSRIFHFPPSIFKLRRTGAKFRDDNCGDAKDTKERNDKQAICDKTLRGQSFPVILTKLLKSCDTKLENY